MSSKYFYQKCIVICWHYRAIIVMLRKLKYLNQALLKENALIQKYNYIITGFYFLKSAFKNEE